MESRDHMQRTRQNPWQPIETVWLTDLNDYTYGPGAILDPEEIPDVVAAVRAGKTYQVNHTAPHGRATHKFSPTGTPGQALLFEYEPSYFEAIEAQQNPRSKASQELIHAKAKLLMEEGYPARQAHAIAASMLDKGRLDKKTLEYYSVEEYPKSKPKKSPVKPASLASALRKASLAKTPKLSCPHCGKAFRGTAGKKQHLTWCR